ncbi:hypothetical protein KKG83_02455 [Candidatus Micrarchaeota archaeon]|nr:hypothetical protein [Candidatus Micrarchaeota archaeon]
MGIEFTKKVIEYFLDKITLFVSLIYIWFFMGILTGMLLMIHGLTAFAVVPLIIALIAYYNRAFSVILFFVSAVIFFLI